MADLRSPGWLGQRPATTRSETDPSTSEPLTKNPKLVAVRGKAGGPDLQPANQAGAMTCERFIRRLRIGLLKYPTLLAIRLKSSRTGNIVA